MLVLATSFVFDATLFTYWCFALFFLVLHIYYLKHYWFYMQKKIKYNKVNNWVKHALSLVYGAKEGACLLKKNKHVQYTKFCMDQQNI